MTENAWKFSGMGILTVAALLYAPAADGAVFQQKDSAAIQGTSPAPGVPLAPAKETRGSVPDVSDARLRGDVRQTVRELKQTGYSLEDIVSFLKSDRRKAAEISIACLNNKFNGSYVHAALLSAGFSRKTADAAVPVALRRDPLLFPADAQKPGAAVGQVFIESNPFRVAQAAGRRPSGVPHIITGETVGLHLGSPVAALPQAIGKEPGPDAVLWDATRSFPERLEQFRNVAIEEQARFFEACSQNDRAKILTHLDGEAKKALYQALPQPLRSESKPLFLARRVEIEVAQGSTAATQDVRDLINWLNAAEKHLETLGFIVMLPGKIIIGQSAAGEYATAQEWLLSAVTFETVGARLIQSSLADEYPDLGYQAIEAFTSYYLDHLLAAYGLETTADSTPAYYQAELETLDSTALYQAYAGVREGTLKPEELAAMVRNAAANYRAMAQAIREISLGVEGDAMVHLVRHVLNSLIGIANPRGPEIAAAFISADRKLNKGANSHLIRERFAAHSIQPADVSY